MEERKANESLALIKSFITLTPEQIDTTTVKGFFQDLLYRIKKVDMLGMAAQLAFFFLLSFFPLIIFLVTLLPYLNLKQQQIFTFLEVVIPSEIYLMVEDILKEILTNQNGGGLLSIGILGTIWSASRGVNALMKTLNRAFDVEGKSGVKNRLWSLLFTIALVGIILIALIFPVFGQHISNLVFSYLGVERSFEIIWTYILWITPLLFVFIILWIMYWVIPNTSKGFMFVTITPGAVIATIGWLGLTYGFSFYINNFGNFGMMYGSIGGVIILMLWLYFTGVIIIFGGLVNASLAKRKEALLNKRTA